MKPDFNKGGGLLPTVVQDNTTKAVLMVAWMNEESFHKTLETKETWFWSRSRQELWHKGGTSGNVQHVVDMEARLRWRYITGSRQCRRSCMSYGRCELLFLTM